MGSARHCDLDSIEAALVINFTFPQSCAQDVDVFAQVFQRRLHRDTIHSFNTWTMARPNAESEPCGGEISKRESLLRHRQRVALVNGDYCCPQADSTRLYRCCHKQCQGIGSRCSLCHPYLSKTG